jgi:hypothetical protein
MLQQLRTVMTDNIIAIIRVASRSLANACMDKLRKLYKLKNSATNLN